MLLVPPPKFRKNRKPPEQRAGTPAPAPGPVLITAGYFPDDGIVILTFDRAVDVTAFDGSKLSVNDPVTTSQMFDGTGGAEQLNDTLIQVFLNAIGSSSGSDVILNAAAGNGIVAVSGGAVWPGVTNLGLPFNE